MSFEGRIIYNSIYIDFLRKWNEFDYIPKAIRSTSRSGSGSQQFINFYNQDFIIAVLEKLSARERLELLQWFEYVKDGDSFEIVRDRGLGGFWAFEKTLKNNDETGGTFTRTAGTANNASYINPSDGLLKFEDTADTPRYSEGKFGHGILIEGSRQNVCQESEDFDDVSWNKTNCSVTDAGTSKMLDPKGGNNADEITASAASAYFHYNTGSTVSNDDAAMSIWVRSMSGTVTGSLVVDDDTGTVFSSQSFTATPEWQRIQCYYENPGLGSADNWRLKVVIDSNGDVLYVYGAQIEVGTDVLFSSRYIQTDGSAKTRNGESVYWSTTDLLDSEQGTLAFRFKPEYIYNKHGAALFFDIYDSGDSNRAIYAEINAAGNLDFKILAGDGTQYNASYSVSSEWNQNEWIHLGFTWNTTIDNGIKIYVNGSLKSTSTNNKFAPKRIGSKIYLGTHRNGSSYPNYGIYDELLIRKDVLTESQINNICNYGNGLGEKKNRWDSVILSNPSFIAKQLRGNNLFDFTLEMEEKLS